MKRIRRSHRRSTRKTRHHARVFLSKEAAALLAQHRRTFGDMNYIERGKLSEQLASHGCSNRTIAHALKVDEGSVRRWRRIAKLPSPEQAAINSGASPAPFLAKQRRFERQALQQRQAEAERTAGAESTRVATEICNWLEANCPRCHERDIVETILGEAERGIFFADPTGVKYKERASALPPSRIVERCRPEGTGQFWLAHLIEWLTRWLPSVAPDMQIREAALRKAVLRLLDSCPDATF